MLRSLAILLGAATAALGATPAGFTPGSTNQLLVYFGNVPALNGAVIPRDTTALQPSFATPSKLNGTSYALLMVDLDIPTNSPPATSTLLHWLQTNLTASTAATTLNLTTGLLTPAYLLLNASNTPSYAPYLQPTPPARIPLSHRYTQILIDMTGAPASAYSVLYTAAQNRTAFNASGTLMAAGLASKVVAGNWFNVTNAGPATGPGTNVTSTTTSGVASATSSMTASSSTARVTAGAVALQGNEHVMGVAGGLALVGLLFAGL